MTLALNLAQALAELPVKRRWFMAWLREHPRDAAGQPYYRLAGRDKLFTRGDLARILAALPTPEVTCPSNYTRPTRKKAARISQSGELTYEQKCTKLQELMSENSRARRLRKLKGKSSVVHFVPQNQR